MNHFSIERRTLLQAMGAAAIAGLAAGESQAEGVPWSAGTEQPKLKAPANACDCHMHIYDSRFPVAPSATPSTGRREARRLSAVAEAYRHDPQCRRHSVDLRHRQFLHA